MQDSKPGSVTISSYPNICFSIGGKSIKKFVGKIPAKRGFSPESGRCKIDVYFKRSTLQFGVIYFPQNIEALIPL